METTRKNTYEDDVKEVKYPRTISEKGPRMVELAGIALGGPTIDETKEARKSHYDKSFHKYGCVFGSRWRGVSFELECICGKHIKVENIKEEEISEFKKKLLDYSIGKSDWMKVYGVFEKDDNDENFRKWLREEKEETTLTRLNKALEKNKEWNEYLDGKGKCSYCGKVGSVIPESEKSFVCKDCMFKHKEE